MITSTANPRVKNLIQLQKKGKVRKEQQCFVVEGIKMVLEAPPERLRAVYMSESFAKDEKQREAVADKAKTAGCFLEVLSDKVFKEASDTMTPQGVMAVVSMDSLSWETLAAGRTAGEASDGEHRERKLFLVLESLQDPGNLGTILRTGEGAGIDGVILNRTSVDPYMPKVIRSTMGSIYRVPIAVAEDLETVISCLKSSGVRVFAAHLKGKKSYYEQDYRKDTCFMIGNEANGLSDALAEMATDYIRIPMSGQVESLNAGVAAALLMYEAKRQRMTVD